jgi:hypothetical protein
MPASQRRGFRKRSQCEDRASNWIEEAIDDLRPSPHKKAKGKIAIQGALEAAGSASKACQKPSTKALIVNNSKSEVAGCGVERLTVLNTCKVYHPFLPGPSVQKEMVGTTAQGQWPWVEQQAEEATPCYVSNAVQKQAALSSNMGVWVRHHI